MALSREAFLAADDLAREEVQLPELPGSVFVRMMTAGERDRYEGELLKMPKGEYRDVRARLAAYTVCDAGGTLLFGPEDIPALSAKAAASLDRIFDVAVRLNRLSKQDVDELEKNSVPDRSSST